MKRLPTAVLADIREDMTLLLAEGGPADDVARQLVRWYRRHLNLTSARRRVARAVAAQRREQTSWPAVTDCDRLDAAFAALEAAGVLARHSYMGCSADGHAELYREAVAARETGERVRGYVFYHFQCFEAAVKGHVLYLAFAAVPSGKAADKRVAGRIVAALAAAGLKPAWDGDPYRSVFVPLIWQRRR